jgi:hypothetical protein
VTTACTASGNATAPGSTPTRSSASPSPQVTSPIDVEPGTTSIATALSATLVTAREPAVPFTSSDNMVTVTYL